MTRFRIASRGRFLTARGTGAPADSATTTDGAPGSQSAILTLRGFAGQPVQVLTR